MIVKSNLKDIARMIDTWNSDQGLGMTRLTMQNSMITGDAIGWTAGNCMIVVTTAIDLHKSSPAEYDVSIELVTDKSKKTPADDVALNTWSKLTQLIKGNWLQLAQPTAASARGDNWTSKQEDAVIRNVLAKMSDEFYFNFDRQGESGEALYTLFYIDPNKPRIDAERDKTRLGTIDVSAALNQHSEHNDAAVRYAVTNSDRDLDQMARFASICLEIDREVKRQKENLATPIPDSQKSYYDSIHAEKENTIQEASNADIPQAEAQSIKEATQIKGELSFTLVGDGIVNDDGSSEAQGYLVSTTGPLSAWGYKHISEQDLKQAIALDLKNLDPNIYRVTSEEITGGVTCFNVSRSDKELNQYLVWAGVAGQLHMKFDNLALRRAIKDAMRDGTYPILQNNDHIEATNIDKSVEAAIEWRDRLSARTQSAAPGVQSPSNLIEFARRLSAPASVWIDPEGHEGKTIYVLPNSASIVGYSNGNTGVVFPQQPLDKSSAGIATDKGEQRSAEKSKDTTKPAKTSKRKRPLSIEKQKEVEEVMKQWLDESKDLSTIVGNGKPDAKTVRKYAEKVLESLDEQKRQKWIAILRVLNETDCLGKYR